MSKGVSTNVETGVVEQENGAITDWGIEKANNVRPYKSLAILDCLNQKNCRRGEYHSPVSAH